MKPWEEHWRARNSVGCTDDVYCAEAKGCVFRSELDGMLVPCGAEGWEVTAARARLAAAAPDMARLLMRYRETGFMLNADVQSALEKAGVL